MNNFRELFRSKKFILLFSMAIGLISVVIADLLTNSVYMDLEYLIMPAVSLIGGPVAALGFTFVAFIHALLETGDLSSSLTLFIAILTSSVLLWKLWYTFMNKNGHDIPNLGNTYNIGKLFIITLIYLIVFGILSSTLFDELYYMSNFLIISPFSMLFTIFAIYMMQKYEIPAYTPKIHFKSYLPEKAYYVLLAIACIIGTAYLLIINIFDKLTLTISIISFIFILIYILKDYDSEVFELKDTLKLNLFNKMNISIFLILVAMLIFFIIGYQISYSIRERSSMEILISEIAFISLTFFAIFLISIFIYMYFIQKDIITPINLISETLSQDITSLKDYDKINDTLRSSITTNNELKLLTSTLMEMEGNLHDYERKLKEVTAQKEKYNTELELAENIQNAMIPADFDESDEDKVKMYGLIEPAYEIGGDFYDYYQLDEDNIGFVIGDITGKGISNSLIMVKAMTLLQDYTNQYKDLSKVFYEVNNQLIEGNVEKLFVRCWLGKLNTKTGELNYINAGHSHPLIKNNAKEFKFLNTEDSLPLAKRKDNTYFMHTIHLNKDDTLLLYTHGAINSINNNGEEYGDARLKNTANRFKDKNEESIINNIEQDIKTFCNNQKQTEDRTLLIIKCKNHVKNYYNQVL